MNIRKNLSALKSFIFRFIPTSVVLMYHRISEDYDPYGVSVHPDLFEEHMEVISKYQTRLLCDIVQNPLKRSIAITFDDGYKDNIDAVQILKKYGVPATFFITTGFIEGNSFPWWIEISDIFMNYDFAKLKIDLEGKRYEFYITGNIPKDFKVNITTPLGIKEGKNRLEKTSLFTWLYHKLKYSEKREREKVIAQIKEQVDYPKKRDEIFMSRQDVKRLFDEGFEIGAHTENHETLSCLTKDEQEKEIKENLDKLEKLLGKGKIYGFAYPFGLEKDFSSDTIEIVEKLGFRYAVTGIKGCVFPYIHTRWAKYRIPRFIVLPWDKKTFERKIEDFFKFIGFATS